MKIEKPGICVMARNHELLGLTLTSYLTKMCKTESSVPPEPKVDMDFRGHPNMVAL